VKEMSNEREHPLQVCYAARAFIETLILWIIHRRPTYGYQVRKEIEQITTGNYNPKPGSIYTILRRMEKKGLLRSVWEEGKDERKRRIYYVTSQGESLLRERIKMIKKRIDILRQLISYYDSVLQE